MRLPLAICSGRETYFSSHPAYLVTHDRRGRRVFLHHRVCAGAVVRPQADAWRVMNKSIAPEGLHQKIIMSAAIYGLFFGLMPPYVLTIVMVATWGVPPLEGPAEQTFRTVYFLRLVLGNVLGLTVGAFLAAAATNLGLRLAGKPTYLRGAVGGALLGAPVGAVTAGSCPFLLLISSSNPNWAWIMIERSFLVGGLMGLTNGLFAGLIIVYFIKRLINTATAAPEAPHQ